MEGSREQGLSPEKKELLARMLASRGIERAPAIVRGGFPGPHPLSSAQERMFFLSQLDPGANHYVMSVALRIRGDLNTDALEDAIQTLAGRHEVLRSVFRLDNGHPTQMPLPADRIVLKKVELQHPDLPSNEGAGAAAVSGDDSSREELIREVTGEYARAPIDITAGPPLRAVLLRCAAKDAVLVLGFHHIAVDGWSLGILAGELDRLYAARLNGANESAQELLDEPAIQYADFVRYEREQRERPERVTEREFWKSKLNDLPLLFDAGAVATPAAGTVGRTVPFELPETLRARLAVLARENECSSFMVLLAAFKTLLYRYFGRRDFAVGSPVAQRGIPPTQGAVGLFLNTLLYRVPLEPASSFREYLAEIRSATLEALAHQNLPFEQLAQDLGSGRPSPGAPLFDVMFMLQSAPPVGSDWRLAGLEVTRQDFALRSNLRFPLELHLWEDAALSGFFMFDAALFREDFIAGMARHFIALLESAVSDPDRSIARLEMLSPAEHRREIVAWNPPAAPADTLAPIELFARVARENSKRIALVYPEARVTYAELSRRVAALARSLRAKGVARGDTVAVLLEPSAEYIACLLAVSAAGGVYLPLDPSQPRERLGRMLADGRPVLLVTRPELDPPGQAGVASVTPNELATRERQKTRTRRGVSDLEQLIDEVGVTAADPLYVMYTSGSTGAPKGIVVTGRGVGRVVRDTNYLKIQSSDVVAQAANLGFDAATLEVWGALLNGARLAGVVREDMLDAAALEVRIREAKITVLFLTTTLFHLIARERPRTFAALRILLFGGEAAEARAVRAVQALDDPPLMINGYGPTECTTFALSYSIHPDTILPEDEALPIGRPISETGVFLLDENLEVVPAGVIGEICLAGRGLALGYLNQAELTAEKFVPMPPGIVRELAAAYGEGEGESTVDSANDLRGRRIYRTGDLGRRRPDGVVEFLGRRDGQLKIRGNRVEPREIEERLREHPAVREAVLTAARSPGGELRLVARVEPGKPTGKGNGNGKGNGTYQSNRLDANGLRTYLSRLLPEAMIPSHFEIDSIPLTDTGKIDRVRLEQDARRLLRAKVGGLESDGSANDSKDRSRAPGAAADSPASTSPHVDSHVASDDDPAAIRRAVLELWEALPGYSAETSDPDFFACGGHSLLAMSCAASLRSRFAIDLSIREFFEHSKLSDITALIASRRRVRSEVSVDPAVDRSGLKTRSAGSAVRARSGDFLDLFDAQVRAAPRAIALDYDSTRWSYAELAEKSEQVRRRLLARGTKPGDAIGLAVAAGPECIATMLGILKAGGVCLPLSPKQPPFPGDPEKSGDEEAGGDRPYLIVFDSGTPATDETWIALDVLFAEGAPEEDPVVRPFIPAPGDPAIKLDRGPALTHGDLASLARPIRGLRISPADGVAQVAAPEEWRYYPEVIGALSNGARLAGLDIADSYVADRFAESLTDHRVSVLWLGARRMERLLRAAPDLFGSLRCLLCDGPLADQSMEHIATGAPRQLIQFAHEKGRIAYFRRWTPADLATKEAPLLRATASADPEQPREASAAEVFANRSSLSKPAVSFEAPVTDSRTPASFAQERMWFLDLWAPDGAYHIAVTLRVQGEFDPGDFHLALERVALRHESLRTVFEADDRGRLFQIVRDKLAPGFAQADLSASGRPLETAARLIAVENRRPFDLERGPLLRAKLLRVGAADFLVLLNLHHIIADGWSLGVLFRELEKEYATLRTGAPPRHLNAPDFQYADFVAGQRERSRGEGWRASMDYWTEQLTAVVPVEFPADRRPPREYSYRGGSIDIEVPAELLKALEPVRRESGATDFVILGALFQILLHRLTGELDIVTGTVVANRSREETRDLIGFFANTLVLRTDFSNRPSLRAIIERFRDATLDAFEHQEIPFEQLVRELAPPRDQGRNPLVRAFFVFQNAAMDAPNLAPARTRLWPHEIDSSRFEFEMHLFDPRGAARKNLRESSGESESESSIRNRSLSGFIAYSSDRYSRETVRAIFDRYLTILRALAREPDRPLVEVEEANPAPVKAVERTIATAATTAPTAARAAITPDRAMIVPEQEEAGRLRDALTKIWSRVFERTDIAPGDDFFQLGGHSLMAARLLGEIRRELDVDLKLSTLFSATTIEAQVDVLLTGDSAQVRLPLVSITRGTGDVPLFLVHPGGGSPLCYFNLARRLGDHPVYGFQAPGMEGETETPDSVVELAELYVAALSEVRPRGPFILGGWSGGGVIAYEMARLLEERGRAPELLLMLDAALPDQNEPAGPGGMLLTLAGLGANLLSMSLPGDYRELRHLAAMIGLRLPEQVDFFDANVGSELLELAPGLLREMPRYLPVYYALFMALNRYVPGPYRGRVALLRTRGDFLFAPEYLERGLRRRSLGGLEVVEVAGTHMSLLNDEHAPAIARTIGALIRRGELQANDRRERRGSSALVSGKLYEPGRIPAREASRRKSSLPDEMVPAVLPATPADRLARGLSWFSDMRGAVLLELDGALDVERLRRALRLTLDAHSVMGTRYVDDFWRPHWERRQDLDESELLLVSQPGDADQAARRLDRFIERPMDAASDPLLDALVLRGERDALCLRFNQVVTDFGGVRSVMRTVAWIYSALYKNPGFRPDERARGREVAVPPALEFDGDLKTTLNNLGRDVVDELRESVSRWRVPLQNANASMDLNAAGSRRTVFAWFSGAELFALEEYAGRLGASMNEVIMAAYFRALYYWIQPPEMTPMRVGLAVDLRRYGRQLLEPTHFTGLCYPAIGAELGSSLDATTRRITRELRELHRTRRGLRDWSLLRLLNAGPLTFPPPGNLGLGLLRRGLPPLFNDVGNLGVGGARFDSLRIRSARWYGPLLYPPNFQVSMFRDAGRLALSCTFQESALDAVRVRNFLLSLRTEALARTTLSVERHDPPDFAVDIFSNTK